MACQKSLGHQAEAPQGRRAPLCYKMSISFILTLTPTLLADVSDFIPRCIQRYNGEDHRRLDHRSRWNETIYKDVGGKSIQDLHYVFRLLIRPPATNYFLRFRCCKALSSWRYISSMHCSDIAFTARYETDGELDLS